MQNVMQALYLTRNARGLPASARRYSDVGKLLNPWYNAKNIAVGYDDNPEGMLFTPELKDEVLAGFRELMPLYLYLDSLAGDPEANKK